MEKVRVVCVKNIFDPLPSRVTKDLEAGRPSAWYVNQFFDIVPAGLELVIAKDGQIIEQHDAIVPPGCSLSFCAVPRGGGGGGGKNILRTVAMIALVVAAPVVGAWAFGASGVIGTSAIGASLVTGATIAAGSLLINSVFPSKLPQFDQPQISNFEQSKTYGWDSTGNAELVGTPLPELFGTRRIVPPILVSYVETQGQKQYLNILMGVAGHQVDAIQDVRINDQPSANFTDISISTRLGTNDQAPIGHFTDTKSDVAIGVKFTTSWITRQTTTAVDYFGVGLQAPAGLWYAADDGSLQTVILSIQIQYRKLGDPTWIDWIDTDIAHSQNTPLRWFYEQSPPSFDQYEYRFRFSSAPPTGTRYASDLYVEYHQEAIKDDFSYPNTALLAIRALATDQISGGTPRISALVSRSTVPIYTGSAYVNKAATNPAWVCWHLLHDEQEGGNVPANRIVYADFEDFADWCDSKNIESHIYFDTEMSLKAAMDAVSQLGRGQVVQIGSKFTVHWDAPDVSTQRFLFTMGNIGYDSFSEEWLSMENRTDAIEVSYWDADNDYKREIINVYQDGFDIQATPINKQSVSLPGCVNRATAAQYGKFLLNKNRYLTLTSSIGADIDAIGCLPNDVIDVAHDVPEWGYSGRVVSATSTTVILDREVTLSAGTTYAIEVKLSDDTRELKTLTVDIETTTDELTVSAWSSIPEKYDIYTFGELNRHYKQFRVLQISRDSELRRSIQCLEYVPEVYDDTVTPDDIAAPTIGAITNLTATETWVMNNDGSGYSKAGLSWRAAETEFIVFHENENGVRERLGTTTDNFYNAPGPYAVGSTYTFIVRRKNGENEASTTFTPVGKTWPPSDVAWVNTEIETTGIRISWRKVNDPDVHTYVVVHGDINGTEIFRGDADTFLWKVTTAALYEFWVYAVDTSGNTSENPCYASVIIEIPSSPVVAYEFAGQNVVLSWSPVTGHFPISEYVVKVGDTYAEAVDLHRTKTTFYSEKGAWLGDRTYWVEAVDNAGNESGPTAIVVNIVAPSSVQGLNAQVIANNVLLRWTEPATHSLPIDYYLWKVGSVYGSATSLGNLYATFGIQQEVNAGVYRYWVVPVDTAGNFGAETSISTDVLAPPNYTLYSDLSLDLTSPDATANYSTVSPHTLPVNLAENWEQHYVNNAWASPDAQITAGYPYYLQPTPAEGYAEWEVDYGTLIPPSRIAVQVDINTIDGAPAYTVDISYSLDGVSWTDRMGVTSVFTDTFRYAKYRVTANSGPDGLFQLNEVRVLIDLQKIYDSGKAVASASDVDGTPVTFSETFLDIISINVAVQSTDYAVPVYIFTDEPNPTEFRVKVFDQSGNRITRNVSWDAVGV